LLLDLSVSSNLADLELVLLEHHLRPTEVLGRSFFERPDSMAPNAALGSDRVIQRTRVSVPLRDDPAIASGRSGTGRSGRLGSED